MNRPIFNIDEAEALLQEGDVLLYRGTSFISRAIQFFGNGPYNHVSVVSKPNGHWETVQFKEFRGGITISFRNDLQNYKNEVDVYRPNPEFFNVRFNSETKHTALLRRIFDGKKVTNCMRELSGQPYNYTQILYILLYKLRILSWFVDTDTDKLNEKMASLVCSTAVAHCFSKHDYDLILNKNDLYVHPTDLANSPSLNYLFTIKA